ncbi:MAG: scaffolding protein [Actinobacteria bacterium]|nr:scaffolding protein [Actinomycetota bacterium]
MAVVIQPTPNPNALKFVVGGHFPTPVSYVAGRPADHPAADALLALAGVTSVFMSADFVTISKAAEAFWDEITPAARRILEEHFAG